MRAEFAVVISIFSDEACGIIALAVVSVIALGGAVVVKKVK